MTDRADQWVGRSLMAVRRLEYVSPTGSKASEEGAIELLWDDRSVMLIDTKTDWTVTVVDREWADPYGAQPYSASAQQAVDELGRWVKRDVSRTKQFSGFIGQTLAAMTWSWNEVNEPSGVELTFGSGRICARMEGGEISVETEVRTPSVSHFRVAWLAAQAEDPHLLYYELVDGAERRKVEQWNDGRHGWASRFVEHGASLRPAASFPTLNAIDADPQFRTEIIDAPRFERVWRSALAGVQTTTLWRPAGPAELALVEASGWCRWPPRLPDQPIFYPVTSRAYAERIAREWNVPDSDVGYVTRFEVVTEFMDRYAVHEAGGSELTEWWIPAEELEDLNDHIAGRIEVVMEVEGSWHATES